MRMKFRATALMLALSALFALVGAAGAFELRSAGKLELPADGVYMAHAEQVVEVGGYLYGLVSYATAGAGEYRPSEVVKFDKDMKKLASVKLRDRTYDGLNANKMVYHDGKLFVTCIGGAQRDAFDHQDAIPFGNIWAVDISGETMTAKDIIEPMESLDDSTPYASLVVAQMGSDGFVMPYDIAISEVGDAYVIFITPGYSIWEAKLFKSTVAKMMDGDMGTELASAIYNGGEGLKSFTVDWYDEHIYAVSGNSFYVRKNGDKPQGSETTKAKIGGDPLSMVPLPDPGSEFPRFFYTAAGDDYGVAGTMTVPGALVANVIYDSFTIDKMATDLATDVMAYGLTSGDKTLVLLREFDGTTTDRLTVWDSGDLSQSIATAEGLTNNAHDAALYDGYLYLACYGLANTGGSAFVRVDTLAERPSDDGGDGPGPTEPSLPSIGDESFTEQTISDDKASAGELASVSVSAPTLGDDDKSAIIAAGGVESVITTVEPLDAAQDGNAVITVDRSAAGELLPTTSADEAGRSVAAVTINVTAERTCVVFSQTFVLTDGMTTLSGDRVSAPTATDLFDDFDISLTFGNGRSIRFSAFPWLKPLVKVNGITAKAVDADETKVKIADYIALYHAAMPEAMRKAIDDGAHGWYDGAVGVMAAGGKLMIYDGGEHEVAISLFSTAETRRSGGSGGECGTGATAFAAAALVLLRRRCKR